MNEQNSKAFVCNSYVRRSARPRKRSSKNVKHICSICERSFVSRTSLIRHELTKHGIVPPPITKKRKNLKCITFKPSKLENYPLLKKLLPENYIYKVNDVKYLDNDKFTAQFEIAKLHTKVSFLVWLQLLSEKSEVTYRVKSCNKSICKQNIFNKSYRCVHNTYPDRFCTPHPKHTNCPASLTVRIIECNDTLRLQNRDNSMMFIGHKAVIILNHRHNHIVDDKFLETFSAKKKECRKPKRTYMKNPTTEYSLNEVPSDESNNQNTSSSELVHSDNDVSDEERVEIYEVIMPYGSEHDKYSANDNIHIVSIEGEYSESIEEFDNNVENELDELLSDYDNVNERMVQLFKSNPSYFIPAIKACSSAMITSLSKTLNIESTVHLKAIN